MTTVALILLDHAIALLSVIAWFAAGVTLLLRRARPALALLAVALLLTLARVASVAVLAGRGWWFVQEKVLLGLPMLVVAAVTATTIAGPRLLGSARGVGRPEKVDAAAVVALFTAAYAALAGFVVTFLIGYPLTLGTALITIAVVIAGVLLTVRVLAAPNAKTSNGDTDPDRPAVSRRRFLGVAGGVVVVGTAGAGAGSTLAAAEAVADEGGGAAPGPGSRAAVSVTDLRGPDTPAPGGVRREYVVTARKAAVRLESGRDIDAWTFDGTVPGPPITATQGDLVEVKLINHDIDGGVTLHWHGYDVPCGEDGAAGLTQDVVAPGGEFVYRFRADQAGTYWYHTHYASHVGVTRGLYGALVVKPREDTGELDLTLPVHTFDGIATITGGAEHLAPAGTAVRLRLINTDSDPHWFALAGTPFRVAAVDGRDLVQPGEISRTGLRLPAAGRYDVVFVMPETSVALKLDGHAATVWLRPQAGAPDGQASTIDTTGWSELDLLTYGAPAPVALRADAANRHFTMVLDRGLAMVDGSPTYARTVNGRGHPSIPDQLVTEGDIVRLTVVNRSLETHPWHLHGHTVLILSRDGKPVSGSPLWVDTFDVRPGQVWEVAFRASNPGIWMNHCHNLPHADQGMMLQLRYDGVTTPFGGMAGMDMPGHH
ncbi:multicopper oxidase family protein [Amycolatopsis taiwanensis]|uniref:multicopper oxidase family protein n=1 Tax=Amycolatopsis taiwanensis TaxID=342230 RepID=UPI0005C1C27E|nr:multicopper oxidase family protein [Amycolatopsis taiwanensis]